MKQVKSTGLQPHMPIQIHSLRELGQGKPHHDDISHQLLDYLLFHPLTDSELVLSLNIALALDDGWQ